jgi:integrase
MASVTKTTTSKGDPRYRVRFRDPGGKDREKWFDRKVDADRFARNIETDKDRGMYVDLSRSRVTFAAWSEKWMRTKAHRKPKTVVGYRNLLDVHILPEFGSSELHRIRAADISEWLSNLQDSGLSASRTRQAYQVINACLEAAVDDDRLVKNPARPARKNLPEQDHREMLFLTHEEVEQLASVIDDPWRTLVFTLAYTGIRWGEACALRRERCHILKAKLHITESLSEVSGALHFGEPKSKKSRRWVDVPRFVADVLGAHIGTQVGEEDNALIFTSPRGAPLRHSNSYSTIWKPAVKKAGLPSALRIHDLRHTAASFMIYEGAHLELVRKQLGHSSITVTQRYAHLYPSQGEDLAARLDERRQSVTGRVVGL